MVKPIMRDILFLGQKSEPATREDIQVGKDLQDTLQANRERCVGMAAQICQHEMDHLEGRIIYSSSAHLNEPLMNRFG